MPARKIVVHRKKTLSHRKPTRRPAPKMLPAATTTAIVNKVLLKNGIRPGTPMHKKLLPSLKSFAVRHQKKLLVGSHLVAAAAGAAAGHYATHQNKNGASGLARLRAFTHTNKRPAWLPHVLDPQQGNTNDRTWFQRLRRVSLANAQKAKAEKAAKKTNNKA